MIFGLAFSLLLIATYAQRKQLVPSTESTVGESPPVADEKQKVELEKEPMAKS